MADSEARDAGLIKQTGGWGQAAVTRAYLQSRGLFPASENWEQGHLLPWLQSCQQEMQQLGAPAEFFRRYQIPELIRQQEAAPSMNPDGTVMTPEEVQEAMQRMQPWVQGRPEQ